MLFLIFKQSFSYLKLSTSNKISKNCQLILQCSCISDRLVSPRNSTVEHKNGQYFLKWESCEPMLKSEEDNFDSFRAQISPMVAFTTVSEINQWRSLTLEQVVYPQVLFRNFSGIPVTYLFKENQASSNQKGWNMSLASLSNAKLWGAIAHFTKPLVGHSYDHILGYVNDPTFKQSLSIKQTGIMYDDEMKNVKWLVELLRVSNICAYLVKTESKKFSPSYSAFLERMNDIHVNNEQFVRKNNPKCSIYYRMIWHSDNQHDYLIEARYYYLFIQFSLKWSKGSKQNVILESFIYASDQQPSAYILKYFEEDMNRVLPKESDVIIPEIFYDFEEYEEFQMNSEQFKTIHPNFMLKLLEKASEHFDQLYFPSNLISFGKTVSRLETSIECFDQSNSSKQLAWKEQFKERVTKLEKKINIHFSSYITKIKTSCNIERTLDTLVFQNQILPTPEEIEMLSQLNFSLGCNVEFEEPQWPFQSRCYEVASTLIVTLVDNQARSSNMNKIALDRVLARVRRLISKWKKISDRTLIINWNDSLKKSQYSLFCNEAPSQDKKVTESLINLARIYNVKIILRNSISMLDKEQGWFDFLKTREELRNYSMACPIFVSRSNLIRTVDKDWKQDPCISWEENPAKKLDFSHVQGISFLFICEIETRFSREAITLMYQFIFQRFMSIELHRQDEGHSCGDSASVLLEADWDKMSLKNKTILMEIHAEKDDLLYWLRKFDQVPVSYKGIHFYGWENMEILPDIPVNLGLTIENCAKELLQGFGAIKRLNFEDSIKYFVCVEKRMPQFPYEVRTLSDFLEDHIYLKSMIQKAFPNTTIYFRMKITLKEKEFSEENGREEVFLRLVGDLTRLGKAYDIHYLFNGFEGLYDGIDDHETPGWWKILDSRYLAKSSVYLETESEYFGRKTWTPKLEEESSNERGLLEHDTRLKIIGILVGLLIVFILVAMILYWKLRKRILSKEAENHFRLGEMGDQGVVMEYLKVKYDKDKFEIPLRRIMLGAVIGTGNFGVVHRATIDNKSYAVKLTKDDTSVQCIRSLLMEVKLLIYVGDHINVIKFEGAYTKEIGYGIIYMVLELCEKGSLDKHLRTLKNSGDGEVDIYELYRFCQEIANGMHFISGRNVVHSDLATRNVLLDSNLTCKVADLGLSRKLNEMGEYVKTSDDQLPWRWMSIESLKERIFTVKSDVWSYGITAWEIFELSNIPYRTEFPVFNSRFVNEIESGFRLCPPVLACPETYKIIKSCWELDPEKRPDFKSLMNHFVSRRSALYDEI